MAEGGPGASGLNVDEEVAAIWHMYQEVRQTAQDNRPGHVMPPRGMISGIMKKPDLTSGPAPVPAPAAAAVTAPIPAGGGGMADMLKHNLPDLHQLRDFHKRDIVDDKLHLPTAGDRPLNSAHHAAEVRLSGVKDDVERLGGLMGRMMHRAEDTGREGAEELAAAGAAGSEAGKGIGEGSLDALRREREKKASSALKGVEHVGDAVRGALHRQTREVERRLDERED